MSEKELAEKLLCDHFTANAALIALMLKSTFPFRVPAEP